MKYPVSLTLDKTNRSPLAVILMSCLFVSALAFPLVTQAGVVITTTNGLGADTYLSNDGQGGQGPTSTHGTDTGFQHRVYDGVRMKILYLRFNKPTNLINYAGSTLTINFTGANRARTCTVYGLNDGDPGEAWNESSISYSNAPGIVFTNGTPLASHPLVDSNRMTSLGTWNWQATAGQQTSDPATLNLSPFLAADTDGLVTFLFVTTSDSSQSYFGTCKEATNGLEPVLTMPNAVVDPGLSNLVWAAGNGAWDIGTTANWNNGVGSAVYQEVTGIGNRVRFDDSSSGASPITITLDTQVLPRSITNASTKNYVITGTGGIGGSTGITKEGSGTLTLGTYNSFVGAIHINDGVLVDGVYGGLGDTTGGANAPIILNGGTLKLASGVTEDVSAHQVTFDAGGATIDTADNAVSFANSVGNNGTGSLTKLGTGTLTLTATAYTGNTYVQQGTLALSSTLAGSPEIVVSSGAVLDLNSVSLPPFLLASAVSQKLSGNGAVDGQLGVTNSTSVSPGGDGVVGTLTISNSFGNGGLQLNGGTLVFDVSTTAKDQIVDYGTMDLIKGTLQLNVTGTLTNGTYKLMTYTGAETGSAASIGVAGFSQPGQIAFLSDATPGVIELVVANQGSTALIWKGDSSANLWDVESTANWLSNGVAAVFLQGDSATFDDSGSASPPVNLTGALFPSAVTVNGTANYTFSTTTGGRLSGSTGLTKNGSGTLTIATDNNNTGPVVVNGGTLQVGDGSSPSHIGNGGFTNNSAVVFYQGDSRTVGSMRGTGSVTQQGFATLTIAGEVSYAGPTTIASGGTLRLGNGGNTGPLLTSAIANDGTLILDTSSSYTYSGPISGMGGLTKNGAGALTLNGNNTETGDLTVGGGVLIAGNSQVIKSGVGVGNVAVNGGDSIAGTLDINGMDESMNGLNGAAGTVAGQIINNGAAGTTNTLTVGNNDAAGDTSAAINNGTAAIALVKTGTGIQIIRGASTYSGGTVIAGGELHIANNTAAGTGRITINDGTTLNVLQTGGNSIFPANEVFVPAGATGKINSSALANGMSGPMVSGDANSTLQVIGPLSWGNSSDLQFSNFTGRVLVDTGGTVRFSNTGLGLNGGDNTTFEVNGFLQTRNGTPGAGGGVHLGAVTGTGTLDGPQAGSGNSTYIIGGKGVDATFSGTINGVVPGSANSFIKIGAGTQTFSGANNYAGSATVSNGVLALAGDLASPTNGTAFVVASPGSLDVTGLPGSTLYVGVNTNAVAIRGNGTIKGSVMVDTMAPGVTITPGFSIGVLTLTGNLGMNSNVTNIMELDAAGSPTSDRIVAAGITYGGTLIITNIGGNIFGTNTFQLFSGTINGTFANVITQDIAGVTWDLSALNTSGTVTLVGPTVNPAPTNMEFSVTGGMLNISWPEDHTGWTLQVQTNSLNVGLSSNWVDVPNSTATNAMSFPVDSANGSVFYRLKFQP